MRKPERGGGARIMERRNVSKEAVKRAVVRSTKASAQIERRSLQ